MKSSYYSVKENENEMKTEYASDYTQIVWIER